MQGEGKLFGEKVSLPYSPSLPKPFVQVGIESPRRWLAGEDIGKQDICYSPGLPSPDMTIAQKKTPRGVFFCA